MAKKVRRVRRPTPTSRRQDAESSGPTLSREEMFRQEYDYVLRDLRRVFMIAGAMFVLLVVLNLLLS